MDHKWKDPQNWDADEQTPYVKHWWDLQPIGAASDFARASIPFRVGRATVNTDDIVNLVVPIPKFAANPKTRGSNLDNSGNWSSADIEKEFDPKDGAEVLAKDTVIIGIVDTGISLSNRRLRDLDGKTRFLASWQQTAEFKKQWYLPFGRELYRDEIDALIAANSDSSGPQMDEDAFNLEADLIEPSEIYGLRDLEQWASHGAHVLDLAAGVDTTDPSSEDDRLADCKIIAVNLPPMYIHGSAGNFLTIFAGLAVERILHVADAIWKIQHGDAPGGFPVVLNFSFGKQAGPKNGNTIWEQAIQSMIKARQKRAPTIIVMPAGNQNLARGNARKMLGPEGKEWPEESGNKLCPALELPWRIMPGDKTPNFLEIWAKTLEKKKNEPEGEAKSKEFTLYVTPPGSDELKVPLLRAGQYSNLTDFARVYRYSPKGEKRPHFVIAVNPTETVSSHMPLAPAGTWKVKLVYHREAAQEVTFCIQSDQAGLSKGPIGLGSYFDHHKYKPFLESGRVRDSYAESCHCEPWLSQGPVQRKGTQNALATWNHAISISGCRLSDAKPVTYSATFDGNEKRGRGRETPTVSYPTDTTPSHTGLLASGAKEGSVVGFRGTSMATALATRELARELANPSTKIPYDQKTAESWLRKTWRPYRKINALKTGAGVRNVPSIDRVARLGEEEAQLPIVPPPPRPPDCS